MIILSAHEPQADYVDNFGEEFQILFDSYQNRSLKTGHSRGNNNNKTTERLY